MSFELFMPFFGDVKHFKVAVRSVLDQTDPNWNLTIIDDVYPSQEPRIFIQELADARITYIRNAQNLGVSKNFQKCVDLAQSQFVSIIGCDDVLLPNYVQRIKSVIKAHPDISYIQPGIQVIDENGLEYFPLGDRTKRRIQRWFHPPTVLEGERVASSLLQGCWTYFPSICWNTKILKSHGFRGNYEIVLDLALQLEILSSGGKLYLDSVPSFAYRRHRRSVSMAGAVNGSRFREESQLFFEFQQKAERLGWPTARRAAQQYFTSRINALLTVPSVLIAGNAKIARELFSHALLIRK